MQFIIYFQGCIHCPIRDSVAFSSFSSCVSSQELLFKQIPSIDQLAIHFSLDGNMIHKDSDEARRQLKRMEGITESKS